MLLRSLLISALLLASACGNKYPFPPQFVRPADFSARVLPAPPAPDSAEFEREIIHIVSRQAKLTDEEKVVIQREDKISPEMIVQPVLGSHFTRESHPALYTLLAHAGSDAWRVTDVNQEYWKSPRPWYADSRVQLIAPKITRYGYPSGHTTTNRVWAHVLSELFPAKRDELFARATGIATHRMQGGVHFPHDLAGGKKLADAIFARMKNVPAFQEELRAAKAELRAQTLKRITLSSPAACTTAGC